MGAMNLGASEKTAATPAGAPNTETYNLNQPGNAPGGVAPAEHFMSQSHADDVGSFNGGAYRISHRDTNSVLTIQLAIGCPLHAHPGAMIAMSPSVTLKGEIKFSVKKLVTGGHMSVSSYTGPGELLLAPHALGDISSIRLTGKETWSVGKDSFLACTDRVVKDYKAQSVSKIMFSGEGWFTYRVSGQGIFWMSSFGAIIRKDVSDRLYFL
jgi:uncharacterized protein (AIM24 family)